jgi:hypothetical protein
VTWFLGEQYWSVWGQRFSSNILAHMTIDTAIVGVVAGLPRWSQTWSLRRVLEAADGRRRRVADGVDGFRRYALAAAAAPRCFESGTAGVAAAVSTLGGDPLWHSRRRYHPPLGNDPRGLVGRARPGPFADISPTTTVPALTLSLIIVSATVLFLSALVAERRQTQRALAERWYSRNS